MRFGDHLIVCMHMLYQMVKIKQSFGMHSTGKSYNISVQLITMHLSNDT